MPQCHHSGNRSPLQFRAGWENCSPPWCLRSWALSLPCLTVGPGHLLVPLSHTVLGSRVSWGFPCSFCQKWQHEAQLTGFQLKAVFQYLVSSFIQMLRGQKALIPQVVCQCVLLCSLHDLQSHGLSLARGTFTDVLDLLVRMTQQNECALLLVSVSTVQSPKPVVIMRLSGLNSLTLSLCLVYLH